MEKKWIDTQQHQVYGTEIIQVGRPELRVPQQEQPLGRLGVQEERWLGSFDQRSLWEAQVRKTTSWALMFRAIMPTISKVSSHQKPLRLQNKPEPLPFNHEDNQKTMARCCLPFNQEDNQETMEQSGAYSRLGLEFGGNWWNILVKSTKWHLMTQRQRKKIWKKNLPLGVELFPF